MLDDFSMRPPGDSHIDWLFEMRGNYRDSFEVTLFTIPMLCTEEWLKEISKLSWVTLAMHGWHHDESEEVELKNFKWWSDMGFAKIYKGPNWKLPGKTSENLKEAGFSLIDKPLAENKIQGHIWNMKDRETLENVLDLGNKFKKL